MNIKNVLPHLPYFWAVVKNHSLSKAAEELHVTPSAVSYQVKILEEELNLPLVIRETGQAVKLTVQGEEMAKECYKTFNYMSDWLSKLTENEGIQRLRLVSPTSFGVLLLIPSLKIMDANIPEFRFDVELSYRVPNIHDENLDLVVGNIDVDKSVCSEKLVRVHHVLIAAKKYLDKAPPLNSLEDLVNHRLIYSDYADVDWARVTDVHPETELPDINNRVIMNDNYGVIETVKGGFGLALVPTYVADLCRDGSIVEVFPEIFNKDNYQLMDTLYVYYPRLSRKSQMIKLMIKILKEHLESKGQIVFS